MGTGRKRLRPLTKVAIFFWLYSVLAIAVDLTIAYFDPGFLGFGFYTLFISVPVAVILTVAVFATRKFAEVKMAEGLPISKPSSPNRAYRVHSLWLATLSLVAFCSLPFFSGEYLFDELFDEGGLVAIGAILLYVLFLIFEKRIGYNSYTRSFFFIIFVLSLMVVFAVLSYDVEPYSLPIEQLN